MGLPKYISASPEEHQTDDFGHGENLSANLFVAVNHLEKENVSGDDAISEIPSSAAVDHREKENFSGDDAISEIPLKARLIVPKFAQGLSVKNAKRKYVSMKESTNLKAKKQHRSLKDLPSDTDFFSREWHSSSHSSETQDVDEEKSDSTSASTPASAGPHECHICQRLYVHHKSLKRHMKTHSKCEAPTFPCQECDAVFDQNSDLEKHTRAHDGDRPYQCKKCSSRFTQVSALKRHERIHTHEKRFSCDNCEMCFTQSSSLKRHQKSHKQTKTFACEFCQVAFVEKHHLETHINSLHGDLSNREQKQFTCEVCSATFFRHSNLWTHKKLHETDKSDVYKCWQCDKPYSTKSNLTRHCKLLHEEIPEDDSEKPYPCSLCGKRFSRGVSLKLHMRFHNTQDLHRCNICMKTFTHKHWLRKHMAVHKNRSKYPCEQCGQGFRSLFLLGIHTRKMGGKCTYLTALSSESAENNQWKYACKYCDKKESLRSKLAKHVRKAHPEVEVFTCDVCDKGFCYYLDFLSHRKTHRYIPYQCKTCQVAFPRYEQLLQHRQDHLHILKSSAQSPPSKDQFSVSELPACTNIAENSSQQITKSDLPDEPVMTASCSKTGPASFIKTESPTSGDTLNSESFTDLAEISSQQMTESDLPKEPAVTASCSKTGQPESSIRTVESPASGDTSNSVSLNCRICSLVFLTTLHYRKHCRMAHGEKKYSCQKCDKGFDFCKQFRIHMKTSHPKEKKKKKKKKKKKSDKIMKPKEAQKFDPVRLDKLLEIRVKKMIRSKMKSSGTNNGTRAKYRPKSLIID